jgi:predicted HTH transcriptional regulator
MTTWRKYYAPKIAEVIKENEGKTPKQIKKILSEMNPGQYGHMKKIWSDESLKQLGLKKRKVIAIDTNQTKLI